MHPPIEVPEHLRFAIPSERPLAICAAVCFGLGLIGTNWLGLRVEYMISLFGTIFCGVCVRYYWSAFRALEPLATAADADAQSFRNLTQLCAILSAVAAVLALAVGLIPILSSY